VGLPREEVEPVGVRDGNPALHREETIAEQGVWSNRLAEAGSGGRFTGRGGETVKPEWASQHSCLRK